MSIRFLAALACVATLALVGCGSEHPDIVPVSGTVTIDGKPVTAGQIMVSPAGHRPSIGPLDDNGRFTLTCFEQGDGVLKGTHLATVTAVEQIDERSNRWHAPKVYANKASSNLWVTIDGPMDNLEVKLTWAGSGKSGPFVDRF
jgi:hypothetical protein